MGDGLERYDDAVARHYAAYRPPLHALILERAFARSGEFGIGLDAGCGTGYSAHALAPYCERVVGIDPNLPMLDVAAAHESVTYVNAAAEQLPVRERSIDVMTFAGSLFYADRERAAAEVMRVCREGALLAVYDFEIRLYEVLLPIGLDEHDQHSPYDHTVNFSGVPEFEELQVQRDRIEIPMTTTELAHVILSDSRRYDWRAREAISSDPFESLVSELAAYADHMTVDADIYYATYRVGR